MRNKNLIYLLGLFLFFITQCGGNSVVVKETNQEPDWIHSKGYNLYPSSEYLVGVGMASDTGDPVKNMGSADRSAFSEIANQLIAHVSSSVSSQIIDIRRNESTQYSNKTTADVHITSSMVVSGLEIVKRYHDKENKIYYSLAVLNRHTASNQFRSVLLTNKSEYDKSLNNARSFLNEGHIVDAISALKQAYSSAILYNENYPYYQIIRGSEYTSIEGLPNNLSTGDVISRVSDILSRLKLIKIAGDEQAGLIGRPLAIPLTVMAFITGETETPVSGLVIGFKFVNGTGEIESSAVTDSNGKAGITVNKLGKSDTRTYSLSAAPDFSEFIDFKDGYKQWDTIFDNNSSRVLFEIGLKKASIPWKILLLVDEPSGGTGINMLSTELTQVGFSPLTERDIGIMKSQRVGKLISQNKLDLLRQEFIHKFDVIITGKINAEPFSKYAGIEIFTASGAIKALSLKTGKVIAEESVSDVKGFGITDDQAKNDVIQKAMQKMTDSLISQLLENNK